VKPDRDITDHRIAKALAHPMRVRILSQLDERTASPSELATELDASLGVVSYHVRTLARLGLLKLVHKKQRRGAVEHYYRAEARPVVTSESWGEVPGIVKDAMVQSTLGQIGDHVTAAAGAGGFERDDAQLTRMPLVLDDRGFAELAAKLDRLQQDADRIAAASEKRLAKTEGDGAVRATTVLMLFETADATTAPAKPQAKRTRGGRSASKSS
jgi:DNA-binding transcriptional ArsR family regulator